MFSQIDRYVVNHLMLSPTSYAVVPLYMWVTSE